MTNDGFAPGTIRSVLEEQIRELGKEYGSEEIELSADYLASNIAAAIATETDYLWLREPSFGSEPQPLDRLAITVLDHLFASQYSDANPGSADAGMTAEWKADIVEEEAVAFLRARGYTVAPKTIARLDPALEMALVNVELDWDREYGWALDLAEELRKFFIARGYSLPPEGPGLIKERAAEAAHQQRIAAQRAKIDGEQMVVDYLNERDNG